MSVQAIRSNDISAYLEMWVVGEQISDREGIQEKGLCRFSEQGIELCPALFFMRKQKGIYVSDYVKLLAQKAELEKKQVELEKALAEARRSSQSAVIAQIKTLMKEHGLTAADLGVSGTSAQHKGKGATVPPKYRNSATGETWSGRGLKPKWVQAALDAGKTLEDFKI